MRIDYPEKDQIPALRRLWKEAFGDTDDFLDTFFSLGFAGDRCHCVTLGGQVGAALYWLDMDYSGGKLAYIYAVATADGFRGRGLCRLLMADVHEVLKSRGYAGGILVPQDAGLAEMYQKMGYQPCSGIRQLACRAADTPISLRTIDAVTYQTLRDGLLPPEAVRLGEQALVFLAAQVRFYAGEGILLAAAREGEKLRGLELLANADTAPGILAELGCLEGSFRLPGTECPFAMFIPLSADAPIPGHLGFAFD